MQAKQDKQVPKTCKPEDSDSFDTMASQWADNPVIEPIAAETIEESGVKPVRNAQGNTIQNG